MQDSFPSAVSVEVLQEQNMLTFTPAVEKVVSTWNNKSVTLFSSCLVHPARHTIDGVRYDAEFIMLFSSYTALGKLVDMLNVCVPVRAQNKESASTRFFHAVVPYATVNAREPVKLPAQWSFSQALPSDPGYFTYKGKSIVGCEDDGTMVQYVVFKQPAGIDPNDIASMNAVAPAKTMPAIPLGSTKVFFNDGKNIKRSLETLQANDDRVYIKCQPLGEDVDMRIQAPAAPVVSLTQELENTGYATQFAQLGTTGVVKLLLMVAAYGVTGSIGFSGGRSLGTLLNGVL
jgi:carbonic anhydrase